ncbi:MAG: HD domain-containing protein [Lentisphaeria bacterium]|nr:HD domain-containing protein [Lentisphaeria bacterium]
MQNKLELFRTRFRKHVETFAQPDGSFPVPVQQKMDHTEEVCAITEVLSAQEGVSEHDAFLFSVCALFHDISRFEQYAGFGTFRDAESFDHGDRSAEILTESAFLAELDDTEREIVIQAIRSHNKLAILPDIRPDAIPAAKMVRDADKLSILNVIYGFFSGIVPRDPTLKLDLPETPGYSEKIMNEVQNGIPVDYHFLRNVNDFLLALFGWVADFNYNASHRYALEHKQYEHLAELLPDDPEVQKVLSLTQERLRAGRRTS